MNDSALDRVAGEIGGMAVVDRLAALSGSDFASLMLEVVRRWAGRETPASVLRRYGTGRFVRPILHLQPAVPEHLRRYQRLAASPW